jgi:hypothetical protein
VLRAYDRLVVIGPAEGLRAFRAGLDLPLEAGEGAAAAGVDTAEG